MKNHALTASLLLCLFVLPRSARAQWQTSGYINFHPSYPLALGLGFDPRNPGGSKQQCIEATERKTEESSLETQSALYLVRSTHELRTALNIDLNLEASAIFASASNQFKYDGSSMAKQSSLLLVLRSSSEFSRRRLEKPSLTRYAEGLIAQKRFSDFKRECGSHYVSMERRGASVDLLITISSLDSRTRSNILAESSASGGFGPIKGSVRSKILSEIERAAQEHRIEIQEHAIGGIGLANFAHLVKSALTNTGDLKEIQTSIGDYLKSFNESNAAPLGYYYTQFGWGYAPETGTLWTERQRDFLIEIVDLYRKVSSDYDHLKQIMAENTEIIRDIPEDLLRELEKSLLVIDEFRHKLTVLHQSTKDKTGFLPKDAALPPYKRPKVASDLFLLVETSNFIRSRTQQPKEKR